MIEVNWTILLQFFNFVLLMWLLNTLLFRPLRAILAQRKETVDGGHARARELKEQIEEKMARYQEQLQQAKRQGNEEKATLRAAAAKEEAQIVGAAHDAASERLKVIKEQVAAEADKAQAELRTQSTALGSAVAAKVLGRAL